MELDENANVSEIMSNIPYALIENHEMNTPNEDILLYDGAMKLLCSDITIEGWGKISYRWQPEANLYFEINAITRLPHYDLTSEIMLVVDEIGLTVSVQIKNQSANILIGVQDGFPNEFTGNIIEPCAVGNPEALTRVTFVVPNCKRIDGSKIRYRKNDPGEFSIQFARHVFTFGDYSVTLDLVEKARDLSKECSELRGYVVTYIGEIVRSDGASFSGDDVREALDGIGYMLSFCCGRWTFPILLSGYDTSELKAWEDWSMRILSPWEDRPSWLSSASDHVLSQLASGYAELYFNPDWSDAIRIATHWYIDALSADIVETKLVLVQCGLELLPWTWFKVDTRHTAPPVFNKPKPDAELNIKCMLDLAMIDTSIPSHFTELTTLSASYPGKSGLGMFILLRNCAVHANRLPNLLSAPVRARSEASLLGLRYFEMLMLYSMGYNGQYKDRINNSSWANDEENVPWAPANSSGG